MFYLVLARKYRPKAFAEMVGQGHVVQALGNALASGRLHHAYFFTGTRGVGKTTVSRILAKSLNCVGADGAGGITATPCGVCQPCRDIDAGRFLDYTELDAASNRGVDEIAQLLDQAVYKPVQGRFKVFMIDEVHMMTNHAFNAMLKTLEEPPEYLKFVLATTDPQKVPVTVLSRCLQFNLRPIAAQTIAEHLAHVLSQEGLAAEPQALDIIARAARGSMRDALSLTDQAIAFSASNGKDPKAQVQAHAVQQMLGVVDEGVVYDLVAALAAGDGGRVAQLCQGLREGGASATSTLERMAEVLQGMAVEQLAKTDAAQSDDTLSRLAAQLAADETQLLYSMVLHGRAELHLAADEHSGLLMALLRFLAFKAPGVAAGIPKIERGTDVPSTSTQAPARWVQAEPNQAPTQAPVNQALVSQAPVNHAPVQTDYSHEAEAGERLNENSGLKPTPQAENAPAAAPIGAAATKPAAFEQTQTQADSQGNSKPSAPVQTSPFADEWEATVEHLVEEGAVTGLVKELALQSLCVEQTDEAWLLLTANQSLVGQKAKLAAALEDLGHEITLNVNAVDALLDTPARRTAERLNAAQSEAEAHIQADPDVQNLLATFGGKVIEGSVKAV